MTQSNTERFNMGTPLPPNQSGNDCTVCWGTGKPFGDGPTPTVIQLRLTSLLPGEFEDLADFQNLLVTHWLTQQVDPCRFEITDRGFLWFVEWAPTATLVAVRDLSSLRFVFVATLPAICQVDMPSDIAGPAGNIAWNGFANITWNPEDL
ncbi:hypothetical protein LCGC14_1857800 [marine sediment metagenome]|uniref:Uncharacterized protein n=1 Tax=marine sediment metagenome TaxID=412755 RepID=A0A0F9IMU3_9ZZZZ